MTKVQNHVSLLKSSTFVPHLAYTLCRLKNNCLIIRRLIRLGYFSLETVV